MRLLTNFLATALVVGGTSGLWAQDAVRKIDPSEPIGAIVQDSAPRPAAVVSPQENDRRIVRWLTIDNRGLAECARGAADRSANPAVKQFAADVLREHEDFLKRFGPADDAETTAQPRAADAPSKPEQTAVLLRDDGASRAGAMIYRPTDFVAVKEEVCNAMKDVAEKQMESLPPQEFDRAFLAHMVFGHHALIASVDALDDTASADLKPQLGRMREMLEHHLTRAGELQKLTNVDTTAARPGESEVK